MAPKASPAPAVKTAGQGAQGNILTKKIGPLPGWAWAAIGLGGLYLWKKHQAAASSTAATTATPAASLPISGATAPSGYGYQGPGTGGQQSLGGPGWNVGPPTGATGTPAPAINPGGVFQPAPGTTPNTGQPNIAPIVAQDNAFTQQLANQTGVAQTGVVLGTGSGLPGGASFITNPAQNDPYYDPRTGI